MMLTELAFRHDQCLKEARELKDFLGSHTSLKERDEILPFFRGCNRMKDWHGVRT